MTILGRSLLLLGLAFSMTATAHSADYRQATVVGEIVTTVTVADETLMELARREGVGFDNLVNANRGIDPWHPPVGSNIRLPKHAILPEGAASGIIINLAEIRLFHLQQAPDGIHVDLYPLGIGRESRDTPEGEYQVINKQESPVWRVPEGLREVDPSLPEFVPPGPANPLGSHWLGLSAPGYGIHGTNRPHGVGRRVSYGCLRLYPEHIAALFPKIPLGTRVQIVYQPAKVGWHGDDLLLEVHPDYLGRYPNLFQEVLRIIGRLGRAADVDYARVRSVVARGVGLPEVIGHRTKHKGGQN